MQSQLQYGSIGHHEPVLFRMQRVLYRARKKRKRKSRRRRAESLLCRASAAWGLVHFAPDPPGSRIFWLPFSASSRLHPRLFGLRYLLHDGIGVGLGSCRVFSRLERVPFPRFCAFGTTLGSKLPSNLREFGLDKRPLLALFCWLE